MIERVFNEMTKGAIIIMKKTKLFETSLYCLSLPFAYIGVWVGADRIAAAKNIAYDIPIGRVGLSATVLLITAILFSQLLKDRHSSLLRLMIAGIITPIAGYLVLTACETLIWASKYNQSASEIFQIRLGVYTGRFLMATICACLIVLILSRAKFRHSRIEMSQQTFS